jgi:hypothetical protein
MFNNLIKITVIILIISLISCVKYIDKNKCVTSGFFSPDVFSYSEAIVTGTENVEICSANQGQLITSTCPSGYSHFNAPGGNGTDLSIQCTDNTSQCLGYLVNLYSFMGDSNIYEQTTQYGALYTLPNNLNNNSSILCVANIDEWEII